MDSDDLSRGAQSKSTGITTVLKRPYCWVYGHDFSHGGQTTIFLNCSRCAKSQLDSGIDSAFLVMLAVPLVAIGLWIRDVWRKIHE